jgi:hypothetical protein
MDSAPNIEILIDNIDQVINKIRVINITGSTPVDLGKLEFAGVWFYWDYNNDGSADLRLFQESRLVADENGRNVYAIIETMNSIEGLARKSDKANRNDILIAGAIDDLIMHRLRHYEGYKNGDDLTKYYTAVMRALFPQSDVYYDLMLNGGSWKDAVDVMVSNNPDYALELVRRIGLDSVATLGNKLSLSARVSRQAVSDQLTEDFAWKR